MDLVLLSMARKEGVCRLCPEQLVSWYSPAEFLSRPCQFWPDWSELFCLADEERKCFSALLSSIFVPRQLCLMESSRTLCLQSAGFSDNVN